MTFQVLLMVSLRWTIISCQLNLYDTDWTNTINPLPFDCLNYHVSHGIFAYRDLFHVVDEVIPYCFRLVDSRNRLIETAISPMGKKLSFQSIHWINITVKQLISWSVPLDVVQQYQRYLDEFDPLSKQYFYNCTEPWFGRRCQYSFASGDRMSFHQIVADQFSGRTQHTKSSGLDIKIPCYVLLECHRNGQFWCLDWREVCDGTIDCFDERSDEEFCFAMEVNECAEDEYRCLNGLCIAEILWKDNEADCLDRSDEISKANYIESCYQDPTFRCEEHSCAPHLTFSCGDGTCITRMGDCASGRHILLKNSMAMQGNLLETCWIAMVCLSKLLEQVNNISCQKWLANDSADISLEQCGSHLQFPTLPIYSNYVRLFFIDIDARSEKSKLPIPDCLCYDSKLCDFMPKKTIQGNATCIPMRDYFQRVWSRWENPLLSILSLVEVMFYRCLKPFGSYDLTKYTNHPSLYRCLNSAKLISKHRLKDGRIDCPEEDDENYMFSCSLDDKYRSRCGNEDTCWSPIVKNFNCDLENQLVLKPIPFQKFCNDFEKRAFVDDDDDDDQIYGESECEDWCDNMYSRCDGYKACLDGRDEQNCSSTICSPESFACISPKNYTVICLPYTQVGDGTDNCLGAADEPEGCMKQYKGKLSQRFRCSTNGHCLHSSEMCVDPNDCDLGEHKEAFCKTLQLTCDATSTHIRSAVEEVICQMRESEKPKLQYFSLLTSPIHPPMEGAPVNNNSNFMAESSSVINSTKSQTEEHVWPWYCNRGVIVTTWVENNTYRNACMCPPSYYGDLCQYQNRRVSLTLRLSSFSRHTTYTIVSMLLDDNDDRQNIEAYDQSIYIAKQSCSIKLNRYLPFSTRTKNISKKYSVRVEAFEVMTRDQVGSWLFPIAFPFLPVNRLAVSINLSAEFRQSSSYGFAPCVNGFRIQYLNSKESFCHCSPGWSGMYCNIRTNGRACPPDSTYLGSVNNRSICVCPRDKLGPQCLFKSICSENTCQNNAVCVPADTNNPATSPACVCSDRFYGPQCQHTKPRLHVSFDKIPVPVYIVAHFVAISNESDPYVSLTLQKLTLFQDSMTIYISAMFHMVIIEIDDRYYLAVIQKSLRTVVSTVINPAQHCPSASKLLNSSISNLTQYQRIGNYYDLCRRRHDLKCFIDKTYLCLCTDEHHANCMNFDRTRQLQCSSDGYCKNQGRCLQDHPTCPSTRLCLCPACFFGPRCEFYAKGLGSTLDEILGYRLKFNTALYNQSFIVQLSAVITMIMFLFGIVNGVLSIMTFSRSKSRALGCGIYLLASSITSVSTVTLFTLKFWLLVLSYQDISNQNMHRNILFTNCRIIEPLLKICLHLDSWLNACVAMERAVSVYKEIHFNKRKSKEAAKHVTLALVLIIPLLFIPQIQHVQVFEDDVEERSWCVIPYKSWLGHYSTFFIFLHYFAPVLINICSACYIICSSTRRRNNFQKEHGYLIHLISNTRKHKLLLISPSIIILLTLPHLVVSIVLDCNKTSRMIWFYLTGYFLSFVPAASIFLIFVTPSRVYRKQFDELIKRYKRRWGIFKLNRLNM